jgi:hypothetical protein
MLTFRGVKLSADVRELKGVEGSTTVPVLDGVEGMTYRTGKSTTKSTMRHKLTMVLPNPIMCELDLRHLGGCIMCELDLRYIHSQGFRVLTAGTGVGEEGEGHRRKPPPSSSSLALSSSSSLPLCKIQPWLQISEGDELDLGEMAGLDFDGER